MTTGDPRRAEALGAIARARDLVDALPADDPEDHEQLDGIFSALVGRVNGMRLVPEGCGITMSAGRLVGGEGRAAWLQQTRP